MARALPDGGLTLRVENKTPKVFRLGNKLLDTSGTEFIHFVTVEALKKAYIKYKNGEIAFLTPIPAEIIKMIEETGNGGVSPNDPVDPAAGYFYRDEFNRFRKENDEKTAEVVQTLEACLLYTSPSPRD